MISTHDKDMVGSWMCCMAPPLADDDRDEFDADAARARRRPGPAATGVR